MIFPLAFLLSAVGEYLITKWVKAVSDSRLAIAVTLSGVLSAMSLVGLLFVVSDPRVAVAVVLGDMVGCYLGVRRRES